MYVCVDRCASGLAISSRSYSVHLNHRSSHRRLLYEQTSRMSYLPEDSSDSSEYSSDHDATEGINNPVRESSVVSLGEKKKWYVVFCIASGRGAGVTTVDAHFQYFVAGLFLSLLPVGLLPWMETIPLRTGALEKCCIMNIIPVTFCRAQQ